MIDWSRVERWVDGARSVQAAAAAVDTATAVVDLPGTAMLIFRDVGGFFKETFGEEEEWLDPYADDVDDECFYEDPQPLLE